MEAAQELANDLKLGSVSNLGILFDSVLHAPAPVQKTSRHRLFPSIIKRSPSATIKLLSRKAAPSRPDTPSTEHTGRNPHTSMQMLFDHNQQELASSASTPAQQTPVSAATKSDEYAQFDEELGVPMSSSATSIQDEKHTNTSIAGLGGEAALAIESDDEHILLVRKIGHDKELAVKLLSQGFRFADPVFIARIMGAKLNMAPEHMLAHFRDMLSMVESTHMIMPSSLKCSTYSNTDKTNNNNANNNGNSHRNNSSGTHTSPGTPPQSPLSSISSTRSLSMPFSNNQLQGGVYVGLLALVEEKHHNHHHSPHPRQQQPILDFSSMGTNKLEILVDKNRHFSFPMIPLRYEDDQQHLTQLGREEKSCVYNLQGQSMLAVSMLDSQLPHETTSTDSGQSSAPILQHQRNNSSSNNSTTNTHIHNSNIAAVSSSLFSPATIMAGIDAPSPAQQTAQIRRFIKALGTSCRSLVQTSNYGKLLGTGARLHAEVLEIPPFTLIPGPCELILFRTLITIPGTQTAINQTPTEPIKCIPLKLYKSFAYHVTDQAIELYRQTNTLKRASIQQSLPPPLRPSSRKKFPQLVENGATSIVETFASKRYNGSSSTTQSLTSSSDSSSGHGQASSSAVELPIMVNLMPTQARFLWLDLMVEETIQANKTHSHHRR